MPNDLLLAPCGAFNPAGQYGGRVFLGVVGALHGARIVRLRTSLVYAGR